MEKECLFSIKNLNKVYGKGKGAVHALKNVSLDIYDGEFLVVLGHSASGKSTLLNLISGIDKSTSGEIFFKGDDITKYSDRKLTNFRRDKIAFVFQFFNLLNDISAITNVILSPGSNKNIQEVKGLFKDIGLENCEYEYPKNLSGGQQQRVAIARALNKKSEVIICDEPTGALDDVSGKAVLSLLEKINQRDKKTIIFVTHTSEIAKMADRVIKMKNGEIVKIESNENKVKAEDIEY